MVNFILVGDLPIAKLPVQFERDCHLRFRNKVVMEDVPAIEEALTVLIRTEIGDQRMFVLLHCTN